MRFLSSPRGLSVWLPILIGSLLLIFAVYPRTGAASTPPIIVGTSAFCYWTNGPDADLAAAEVGIWGTDPEVKLLTPLVGPTVHLRPTTEEKVNLSRVMGSLPDGEWTLRVRLRDAAGNVSDWSDSVPFRFDTRAPSRPTGARIGF
jgi:hypothetical protein